MPQQIVKIFKDNRADSCKRWWPVISELVDRGHKVYCEAEPADVSIVMSGQFENPLSFSGKRVLAFAPGEWLPEYWGWRFWGRILEHYYDDHIDLTGTKTIAAAVDKIVEYVNKC
jgi:hypothetical protein